VYTLVKKTFNNFKKAYSSQPEIDEEKAAQDAKNERVARRAGRRHDVCYLCLQGLMLTYRISESCPSQES
jgi:hypothetical protein